MTGAGSPGRIVVGVDGSAHSAGALRWALAQAVRTGAGVVVIACWERAPSVGFAPYLDVDLSAGMQDVVDASLAGAVLDTDGAQQVATRTHVIEGYPPRVLVEAAEGADLLVVGSRGHGELSGLLLGSVGLHCASHAPCPVVIVRGSVIEDRSPGRAVAQDRRPAWVG